MAVTATGRQGAVAWLLAIRANITAGSKFRSAAPIELVSCMSAADRIEHATATLALAGRFAQHVRVTGRNQTSTLGVGVRRRDRIERRVLDAAGVVFVVIGVYLVVDKV